MATGLADVAVANSLDNRLSVLINGSPRAHNVLTVSKTGTGGGTVTSNPSGIDCGSTCSAAFEAGSQLVLTAQTGLLSVFGGWAAEAARGRAPGW